MGALGTRGRGQGLEVGVRDLRGFGSLNSSHRQQRPHRSLLGSNLSLPAAVGEVDTKMDPTATLSGCAIKFQAMEKVVVQKLGPVPWGQLCLFLDPGGHWRGLGSAEAEVALWSLFPTPPSGWDTSFPGPFSLPLIYNPSR